MELCVICKENETGRLMDIGGGKKVPVCTDCLTSGRWREPLPVPVEPEPAATEPPDEGKGFGDYLCPQCKVTHRAGSKVHKRHLKLLKGD